MVPSQLKGFYKAEYFNNEPQSLDDFLHRYKILIRLSETS